MKALEKIFTAIGIILGFFLCLLEGVLKNKTIQIVILFGGLFTLVFLLPYPPHNEPPSDIVYSPESYFFGGIILFLIWVLLYCWSRETKK